MMLAMIAAVAENGVIGSDGAMPWHIPSDFAFFKRMTMGKPIIMGRKQFETVGKPLPGRSNIVITRQTDFSPPGVLVVATPQAALDLARSIAGRDGVEEIMVIGGGEIYRQFLPLADRLLITHVDLAPAGSVTFPAIVPEDWTVIDVPEVVPDPRDQASYRVKVYARRAPGAH